LKNDGFSCVNFVQKQQHTFQKSSQRKHIASCSVCIILTTLKNVNQSRKFEMRSVVSHRQRICTKNIQNNQRKQKLKFTLYYKKYFHNSHGFFE